MRIEDKISEQKFPLENGCTAVLSSADEGGYYGWCLQKEGAYGQGETLEEALHEVQDAINQALAAEQDIERGSLFA